MSAPPRRPRRWVLVAQVLASAAILVALVRVVDAAELWAALRRTSPGLLALALAVRAFSITLHEVRLWVSFPRPRPPLLPVISIGLTAGVLNLFLPGRGGDIAAVAMLTRELGVKAAAATAAVAITVFIEAAVFAALLLAVLVGGAARWEEIVGVAVQEQALQWVTVGSFLGLAGAVGVVVLGRLLARRPPEQSAARASLPARLQGFARDAITRTGSGLSDPRPLLENVVIGVVQVTTVIASLTLGLDAVGISVGLPWLVVSGVLVLSSFASVALPPTYGAGPAAASVAVLGVFGVGAADALAFAVVWWLLAQLPAAVLGLPCLWTRRLERGSE